MEKKLKYNIGNNIQTFHHIYCNKCKKEKYINGGDEYDAVDHFITKGWYATENNCYCPECQIKRKRN